MEVRIRAVGQRQQVQHSHHAEIPIQSSKTHNKCTLLYRVSQEERSIFWEVILSVILSKNIYMYTCPILNGFNGIELFECTTAKLLMRKRYNLYVINLPGFLLISFLPSYPFTFIHLFPLSFICIFFNSFLSDLFVPFTHFSILPLLPFLYSSLPFVFVFLVLFYLIFLYFSLGFIIISHYNLSFSPSALQNLSSKGRTRETYVRLKDIILSELNEDRDTGSTYCF